MKRLPKTDEQLLRMAHKEETEQGVTDRIFTSTYSLLRRGLLVVCADNVTVKFTDAGRARAAKIALTPEGQAYRASSAKGKGEAHDGPALPI